MEFELHSLGVMPGCRHDNIVWLPSDSHAVANASIISEAWFASVRAKAGWAPDYMHTLDLGVGQDLAGGALHHCLQFMPGANRSQRLAALWAKLRTWYKAHRTSTQKRPTEAILVNLVDLARLVHHVQMHVLVHLMSSTCCSFGPPASLRTTPDRAVALM